MTIPCPRCGTPVHVRVTWREVARDDGTGCRVVACNTTATQHRCPPSPKEDQ